MFRYISGANAPGDSDGLIAEGGGINVRTLPEDVQAVFADIDANGDGVLDMDEFKTMLSTYAVLRRSNQEGSVSIATLPDKVQPALKVFDARRGWHRRPQGAHARRGAVPGLQEVPETYA